MFRGQIAPPARWEIIAVVGLVLIGLALRFAWLSEASTLPFFTLPQTDDYVYQHGAARIAAGDFFLRGEALRFGPPYFYVLGVLDLVFGEGQWPPRIFQALLGGGVVPLVWLTTRTLTSSPGWSLAAAGASALYGPAMFFEALLLPEAAMTLVYAGLGLALVRAASATTRPPWAWVGALLGIAVAFRPNALLLIVPVLAAAARTAPDRPETTQRVGAVLLALVIAVAPMSLRNVLAIGTPVSASTAGINAYIGNGPGATGMFRVPPEVPGAAAPRTQFEGFRDAAAERLGHAVTDSEADTYWLGQTLDHVATHPLDALYVLGRKAWLFWNARELSNLVDYEFTRGLSTTLGAPLVQFGWVAPLGLLGMVLMLGRRRSPAERALATLLATGFVSVILVFVQDRYRIPFVPWVIACGACGGKLLVDTARSPERKRAIAPAIALVAIAAFVVYPAARLRPHLEQRWTQLGVGYEALGRSEEACTAFEHALEAAPDFEDARAGRARSCGH